MSVGDDDMLTDTMANAALWVILVAIIAIVPIGCFATRPKKETPHKKNDVTPAVE